MNNELLIIESFNSSEFESRVNELLNDGFKIAATSIGFINSEAYRFQSCYQAILIKEDQHALSVKKLTEEVVKKVSESFKNIIVQ